MSTAHKITARGYPAVLRGYSIARMRRSPRRWLRWAETNTGNARVRLLGRRVYSLADADIRKYGHVLTPGRYVGALRQEDDGEPFEEKMKRLTATLREQQAEAAKLDAVIAANLEELGF